jgi:hypothetical protein
MPAHDFFFSLELSSQGLPAALLEDLALNVFHHCGCGANHADELRQALQQAVDDAKGSAGPRRCDVQFRAGQRKLDVLVTANGGRLWQATIPLP